MILRLFLIFLIPVAISLLITPWVIRFAARVGAMDEPNVRKIHSRPIPRLGGVVIYTSFFLSIPFLYLIDPGLQSLASFGPNKGMMTIAALVLILGLGIFDDLKPRTPAQKLLVQIIAATLVYLVGFKVSFVSDPLSKRLLGLGILEYPATLLWIVGITNAFNLIDGLDGLAAGVAIIASFTIATISFLVNDMATTIMVLLLAGAVVGFIRYNFNPAKIFLGDSGSLFLGFALAVFSMRSSTKGSTALAIIVPILCLGLPIMDTLLSMLRRLLGSLLPEQAKSSSFLHKFGSIFVPDNGHIHHRLIARGFSHRNVVLLLYLVSCAFGIGAFTLTVTNNVGASLVLVAVAIATIVGVRQLHYKEMAVLRNGILLPIYEWPLMNRRVFQGFLDLAFILVAYASAFFVVSHGRLTTISDQKLLATLPFVGGIKLLVFYATGQYKGTFRHLSIGDALRTLKVVVLSELMTGAVLAFLPEPWKVRELSILFLDFFFVLTLVGGIRTSFFVLNYLFHQEQNGGKRVIIYGADARGILALQQILNDETLNLSPIGFLDDSPHLEGKRLNGYPIYGGHWKLQQLLRKVKIEEILLSSDNLKPEILRRLKQIARSHGISVRRFTIRLEDVKLDVLKRQTVEMAPVEREIAEA
jgi:UDP-GlcNAc:undecaprenyl-phosphate GlcNAc-1-phosphate transferase